MKLQPKDMVEVIHPELTGCAMHAIALLSDTAMDFIVNNRCLVVRGLPRFDNGTVVHIRNSTGYEYAPSTREHLAVQLPGKIRVVATNHIL